MVRAAYRALTRDLGLKLFSVFVAVTLWFYVLNTQDPMRTDTIDRPVQPVNVPEGLEAVRVLPESIALRLVGRVSALDRARLAGVQVLADLSEGQAGRNQAALRVANLPDRVTLEDLPRQTAQVWLDERTADKVPVTVLLAGAPPEGYEVLGDVTVEPPHVRIAGPAGVLERLARVVARVNVGGLTTPQRVSRELEALDNRQIPLPGITLEPQQVIITVPIHLVATKQVAVRPRIGAPAAGYVIADVRASPDTVTIKGRPEVVRQVREVVTEWQNISALRTTRDYNLRLVIPAGVQPVDDVRTVRVQVAVRPAAAPPAERRTPETEDRSREAAPSDPAGDEAPTTPEAEPPARPPTEQPQTPTTPAPARPGDAAARDRAPADTPGRERPPADAPGAAQAEGR